MISELLLILELLLFCLVALLGMSMSEAKNLSSPLTCTNVPYPFGKSDKAMPGFEITCGGINGTTPILQLNHSAFPVEDISLLQGQLSIQTGALFQRCNGKSIQELGGIHLEGTPYTISSTEDSENMLKLVGCNHMVIIQGLGSNSTSGCVTFCYTTDSVVDGSCSGLGCCQGSVPKGLKSFNPSIFRLDRLQENQFNTSNFNTSFWNTICSDLFIVRQSSFSFSRKKLWSGGYSSRSIQNAYTTVLDWAIGNETCEEAKRTMATYACKENSYCYDSTNGVGYLCNCSQGYQGNPYIKDGCTDINECEDPELNPCEGRCINEPGSVSCACPFGQRGDGKKNGTGCSKIVSLELALGVGLSLSFIVFTGSLLSYWILKKRKLIKMKARFFQQNGGLFLQQQIPSEGSNATLKIFNIEELEKATNNFNESQILGRGGYGTVYKGVLPSLQVVAIKKSKLVDESQTEQFINEIIILSQISHRNVVKLLGCCLETQVPLLVYEFISNRTLFHHIHGESLDFLMPWEVRLRIAAEAAGALAYLHSAASVPIIHRDVKSTNILLDENYTAKVSDFGASRSVPFDQTHITTLVQGTFGYLDPEYFHTSKLTEKSDVYSFGVVLVELLTGEIPVSFARSEDQRNLATYFTLMFDEQHLLQLVEPRIVEEAGMKQFFEAAQLARRCLNLKGEERPTMKEVAMELEGIRRFHKQQLAPPKIDEMEHLLGGIGPSNESLHSDMFASMHLPR